MIVADALRPVARLFLDTAPIIYFVERNPTYALLVDAIFQQIDAGTPLAVTSAITLAECLVHPFRKGLSKAQKDFTDLITAGKNVTFVLLDQPIAAKAAELRARYNLELDDAFQVAAALAGQCDALLTNDNTLQRVQEIKCLLLDDLQP